MTFHAKFSLRRWTITASGIPAIILLIGILALPYLLAGSLEPEEAERRIREYLLREVTNQQLSELEDSGTDVPDERMALRWKEQIDQVNNMEFVSVEVRRAVFVPPLRKRTNFAVKAVISGDEQPDQTRYFWFNGVNTVRESSKLEWYLPI